MSSLYTVLGLPETATDEQIKQAYRTLAKRYHPDLHPGDAETAKKFAMVNEAMETLGTPQKRKEYDAKRLAEQKAAANAAAAQAAARQAQAAQARAQTMGGARGMYTGTAQGAATVISETYRKGYNEGYAAGQAAAQQSRNATAETWKKSADNWQQEADKRKREAEELGRELALARQHLADAQAATRRVEASLRAQTAATEDARRALAAETAAKDTLRITLENKINLEREARKFADADKVRLSREMLRLREENGQMKEKLLAWEAYGMSEEEDEELYAISDEWTEMLRENKKRVKGTYYSDLNVLFWATQEEIVAAYENRIKRLKRASDAPKRQRVDEAYKVLSDPMFRLKYNAALGITDEDIETMRRKQADYEQAQNRLDEKAQDADVAARLEELTSRAFEGDGEAALLLGEMYLADSEVPKDEVTAVRWFTFGAEKGNAEALYRLGLCLLRGEGTAADPDLGREKIKEAAQKGNSAAIEFIREAENK